MHILLHEEIDSSETHGDTVKVFDGEYCLGGVATVKRVKLIGAQDGEVKVNWFLRQGPPHQRSWFNLTESDYREHVHAAQRLEEQYRERREERDDLDARERKVRRS